MGAKSNLERILCEGTFAVTAEICPPKGADPQRIQQKAEQLRGYADALNITDNQTAVVRLSSMAGSILLLKMKLEPIMQMTCRDRNRIALQSDVLGASALGIRNILCLTGDHQSFGNHPKSKGVYDLDAIQLIQVLTNMRDTGVFQNGEEIPAGKPILFIGAAANPFSDPYESIVDRLEKKVAVGADFIQTQSVFNIDTFAAWMDEVRSRGLDKKVHILAGVTPLKSLKMMMRMKNDIPGADVPDIIAERMQKAADPVKEGYEIGLELTREIRKIHGIHGVHITALFWEDIVPSLVKEVGLFPRP